MLKATRTERERIRDIFHSHGATFSTGENEDGTVFLDIYGVVIEAGSLPALLRELAAILEES